MVRSCWNKRNCWEDVSYVHFDFIAKRTSSVRIIGQKLLKLCGESLQSNTLIHRYTSLCTIGDTTPGRSISTSFSCMRGS